ncbi:MAG: EamA family transporter [Sulfurospirillum sp.]|nr:EamA family transporter [Sulfurospirillum sp.]
MAITNISIIILSLLMSSTAHIFLKKGMMTHAASEIKTDDFIGLVWTVGTNPWVMGGMFLHVSALVVWLWALSKVDISFAYPFLALGYVLVSTMAWFWLGEELNSTKILGMGIIIVGILVLAKAG